MPRTDDPTTTTATGSSGGRTPPVASGATAPRDWDARSYDQVGAPMTRRGLRVVDALDLRGDEAALDAGCGTGRVTEALLQRLPHGRVTALDGSPAMVDVTRDRLGDDPRVAYAVADLREPLPVADGALDVVVSTSTFHWVPDHQRLWHDVARVLKPGGTLAVDCGGAGNIAAVLAALAELGVHDHPWTFDDPDTAVRELTAAGFTDVHARLRDDPAPLGDPAHASEYLRTVVLGTHLQDLPPAEAEALVRGVLQRMGPEPTLDYVRLEVHATRA